MLVNKRLYQSIHLSTNLINIMKFFILLFVLILFTKSSFDCIEFKYLAVLADDFLQICSIIKIDLYFQPQDLPV